MLQSGFLLPVDESSHMSVFERILTDIGDNQSIENELSTYSYRLKNMQRFLKKCDEKTLFLIDEFGRVQIQNWVVHWLKYSLKFFMSAMPLVPLRPTIQTLNC
jgi:hypothetical protein